MTSVSECDQLITSQKHYNNRGVGEESALVKTISSFISVLTFALTSQSVFVAILSLFPLLVPWPQDYENLKALLVVLTARRESQTIDLNLGCNWFHIMKA